MLDKLFGSRTRAKLLLLFFTNAEGEFFVRELTRKIDEQINSVRRELDNLLLLGIVKHSTRDKKKYYSLNKNSSIHSEMSQLIHKMTQSVEKDALDVLSNYIDQLDLCVLTGTFVDLKAKIQTDLLLVGDLNKEGVEEIVSALNDIYKFQLNYTVFTPQEYQFRLGVNDRFVQNILQSKKIVLYDRKNSPENQSNHKEWGLSKPKRTLPKISTHSISPHSELTDDLLSKNEPDQNTL